VCISNFTIRRTTETAALQRHRSWHQPPSRLEPKWLRDLYTESGQTLQGSFSAVSTPIFASKYALESSRRDLHNALLCTVLNAQNFRQKSLKCLPCFSPNFAKFDKFSLDFAQILLTKSEEKQVEKQANFAGFLPNFRN